MLILIITTLILALIIGVVLIGEWSMIAVKAYEEEQKDDGNSKTGTL